MSYHGLGRRGGEENLWPITYYGFNNDSSSHHFNRQGRIFNGLRYPHSWEVSFQAVLNKSWRRWQVGWNFETVCYNDEQYGVYFHLLPLSLYLHLDTNGILPKPTKEREWKLVAMFSEGVATDVNVHYQLGPGGVNPKWKDRKGRKIGGVWSLNDWLFGRNKMTEHKGEEYDLDVPLPERSYRVHVTVNERVWKRPRWGRWPLVIRHQTADIDASMDPMPEPGNDDSDFYDGEDAIFGTGVPNGTRREVAQRVADQVMKARKRRGKGYDWRPTRDWRPSGEVVGR